MKVRIIFKSKYACEKDWSDGKCNQALYEKDKAALVDWKKSHKIIRYLIPLVETVLVFAVLGSLGSMRCRLYSIAIMMLVILTQGFEAHFWPLSTFWEYSPLP